MRTIGNVFFHLLNFNPTSSQNSCLQHPLPNEITSAGCVTQVFCLDLRNGYGTYIPSAHFHSSIDNLTEHEYDYSKMMFMGGLLSTYGDILSEAMATQSHIGAYLRLWHSIFPIVMHMKSMGTNHQMLKALKE